MKSLYSELLKRSNENYNNSKVVGYIMIIKRTTNPKTLVQAKHQLYFYLSKIMVKAVNNFSSLTKGVPEHKLLHTHEDIAIECFLILDKCVQKLDMKYVKQFYFYLNSALNRAMYRLYVKNYQKNFNVLVSNGEENEFLLEKKGYEQQIDFSEIDLSSLTELERDVLKFKMSGDKLNKFLKDQNIPSTRYYQVFESAKEKLYNTYKHEYKFNYATTNG